LLCPVKISINKFQSTYWFSLQFLNPEP
jgi:hypothetical protein